MAAPDARQHRGHMSHSKSDLRSHLTLRSTRSVSKSVLSPLLERSATPFEECLTGRAALECEGSATASASVGAHSAPEAAQLRCPTA